MANSDALRPLWVCPKCGKRFVNRNSYHSCLEWPLERHFDGTGRARELFDAFPAAVGTLGPVTLVCNKSVVGFMTRARFAGCQPRRNYLDAAVWLKRRVQSPRIRRIDQYGPHDFVHRFYIRDASDIDREVLALLAEARSVGDQDNEQQRRRYRKSAGSRGAP